MFAGQFGTLYVANLERKTATQRFLEGRTIEKVEHPPREIVLHLGGGDALRISAYASGLTVSSYGLDFVFEKDGRRVG